MWTFSDLTWEQRLQVAAAREPAAIQARASRVLASILSGACTVAPAPGAFPVAVCAVLAAAAQAARLARTAKVPPRTQPKRAPKVRAAQTQPYAAEAKGWVNPQPAAPRLGDTPAAAALKAVVPAAPPPRRTPPPAAECRRLARIKAGVKARQEAAERTRAQAAKAWLDAHAQDLPEPVTGPEVFQGAATQARPNAGLGVPAVMAIAREAVAVAAQVRP